MGVHPGDGMRPSCGYWLTILGYYVTVLGIVVTILGIVCDHPWDTCHGGKTKSTSSLTVLCCQTRLEVGNILSACNITYNQVVVVVVVTCKSKINS